MTEIHTSTRLATWNLEWATARQERSQTIRELVEHSQPDVACFTEVLDDNVPYDGHAIFSTPDYGYNTPASKRKVCLVSNAPWEQIDDSGSQTLPGGRFITGVTRGIRFIGVCIPWHDAHVSTGRKDRSRWQDHLSYLEGLKQIIRGYASEALPLCIVGDYNQRVPKGWQPPHLLVALKNTLSPLNLHTSHTTDSEGKHLIDHVSTCSKLSYKIEGFYPKSHE